MGCGDIALRVADLLRHRARLVGLTRNRDDVRRLRMHGVVPLVADLDDRRTLARIDTSPFAVVHSAPPPSDGRDDPRTRNLLAALASARIIPR
ncbi:MAG TPA: NAD-binding protein, partial [Casimicrobiaceae bacterium]